MLAADVFTKLNVELKPDPSRTVIRPFNFGYPSAFDRQPTRAQDVARRVMELEPTSRDRMLELLQASMEKRHRNVDGVFLRRFDEVKGDLGIEIEEERDRLLLGAYFSQEYAFDRRPYSIRVSSRFLIRTPTMMPSASSSRSAVSARGTSRQ